MSTSTIIFLVVVIAAIAFVIAIYNRLVSLRNRFKNAFSQIDVQLQRRYDLIPNLVETAKTFMKHEKETLTAVIEARNQALAASKHAARNPDNSGAIKALSGAEGLLGSALGNFFALSESYPELQANENMAQLMEELSSTENRIAFSRQAYNDAVMVYNTYREQFPNSIIASRSSFNQAESLELENPEAKKAVKVSF
ncbi:hypothetical protein A9Q81_25775 [Gammaproteobacteria bacterium 42_54_T18]|nr:hypothetical protein A9Q81_25775 [Gammaproteobacteria bacterium 42_54_T18]